MRKLVAALTIALPLCIGAIVASAEEKAAPTQQNKMATCNKDAGDKKGEERKAQRATLMRIVWSPVLF